jgi:hypothetical protein
MLDRLMAVVGTATAAFVVIAVLPVDWSAGIADPRLAAAYGAIVVRVALAWATAGAMAMLALWLLRRRGQHWVAAFASDARSARDSFAAWLRTGDAAVLAAITLGGAILRARYLLQPVRTDEAATFLYYAFQPLAAGVSIYGSPNNHLLHTLLVHLVYSVAGDVPALLRLPSFLAGVAIIPATCLAGRRLVGREAGLMAAALAAGWPSLVDYAALARGYSPLTLAFLIALIAAKSVLDDASPAATIVLALALALGFWTIPTMLYAAAVLVSWAALQLALTRRSPAALILALLLGAALTLAAYLPVLAVSGLQPLAGNAYLQAQSGRSIVHDPEDGLAAIWHFVHYGLPVAVQIVIALAAIAGLVITTARRRTAPFWIGVPLALTPLLLLTGVVPYHRTWLFLIPLWLLLVAAPIARLLPTRVAVPAALVVGLAACASTWATNAVWFSLETGSYRDGAGTAAFLRQRLSAGDCVVATVPADVILEYEFARVGLDRHYLARRPHCRRTFVIIDRSTGQHLPPGLPGAHLLRETESGQVVESGPASGRLD